jgi:hypothetical protein
LVGGAAAALAVAAVIPAEDATAAKAAVLKLTDINIGDFSGVAQNAVIEMTFTQAVDPATVNSASLQMRAQNSTKTGFSIEVPGSFQVAGSVVRYYPRLPTHLRDPGDPLGGFYQPGTTRDNAIANAGFQPNRNHQVIVVGAPSFSAIRSLGRRPLNRTYKVNFATSPETPKNEAFTIDSYIDAPPPGFKFSNPPDKVASVTDQYARNGGTQNVPSAVAATLFGNKVPLSPATVRQSNNVVMTLLSRAGDTSFRKVMQGTPFLEQNFDTVRLVYQPRFPLPDMSSYALRVTNGVKDLTEVYQFTNNAERLNLRQIYEFLVAARALNPGVPPSQLADPPVEYIVTGNPETTWPSDPVERGILKTNVLALGDTYPDEVDPRVMTLFTTRDEAVTHASLVLSFVKSDGYFNAGKSTAEWDQTVAGAASAIFTASGGSAALGDLAPSANTTLSAGMYPGGVFNFRNVNIPAGVTVTFLGSAQPVQPGPQQIPVLPQPSTPVTLKCISFLLDGQISADGATGIDGSQTNSYSSVITTPTPAVPGGPGGGYGGYAPAYYSQTQNPSGTGGVGNDENLIVASPVNGGRGGLGGQSGSSTAYTMASGGGGGGGSRQPGTPGGPGVPIAAYTTTYPGGPGGAGGAAATGNSDLAVVVGGAGGGGGGNAQAYTSGSYYWGTPGASGGGGGGALVIQTSGTLTIGASGVVHARGGRGGGGVMTTYTGGGGGGGGGGGAILLRSSRGFNLVNPPVAVDVAGGAGGTPRTSTYGTGGTGGNGGAGFKRFEDPNGGLAVAGGTQGGYSPVGGGVPSYVYSNFIDLGVDSAKLLNFKATDFLMTAGNDAILIEVQAAIENPANLGFPKTSAIDASENSTNVNEVSQWTPVRLLDNTSTGSSFYVPGNTSTDAVFPIETKLNGKNYRFVRLRITFQLDSTQTASSPLPFVDQITIRYDFNF